MILSRKEFNLRWSFRRFKVIEEKVMCLPVSMLMCEIKEDAPFRNHQYLFDGSDLSKLKCDDEVGVNKFCGANVQTEKERLDFVEKQVKENSYEPVAVFQHVLHPTIIYVDDGFHRIYSAHKLKKGIVLCKIKKGYFILEKAISIKDLQKLLQLVREMFPALGTIVKILKFLETVPEEKREHTSIGYGGNEKT